MKYEIRFLRQAEKDIRKLTPKLKKKLMEILRNQIAVDPTSGKALVGDLKGFYSVRLSYQDRVVYSIEDDKLGVYILGPKRSTESDP